MASVSKFVGLASDDASYGTNAWQSPTLVYSTDGAYAYNITSSGTPTSTHYIKGLLNASGGMGVPADAIITGVRVSAVCQLSINYSSGSLGNSIKLVVGGSASGTDLASVQYPVAYGSWGTLTWGGDGALWGLSLSPAQVNAPDFGVVLAGLVWSSNGLHSGGVNLNSVQITVYYTLAVTGSATLAASSTASLAGIGVRGGTATLAASSTASAAGRLTVGGAATLAASTIGALAGRVILGGGATLIGLSDLVGAAIRVITGSANLSASGGTLAHGDVFHYGDWTSAAIPVSSVGVASSSIITWTQATPSGSSVVVETSLDNGATWATCANGGSVAGVVPGASLAGLSLLVRVRMSRWVDGAIPSVSNIAIAIQSAGEKWRVLSVAPQPRGPVTVVLAEPFQLSQATSQVESTGGVSFDRTDTRTDPARPNPGAVPPSPPHVYLSILEDTIAGSTRYKIAVSWSFAPSSFVTGYLVSCTANGGTRDVGTFAANYNSCTVSAVEPNVLHTITVTAMTAAGKSASASASIIPGSTYPTIALTCGNGIKYIAPFQDYYSDPEGDFAGCLWGFVCDITDPIGLVARVDIWTGTTRIGGAPVTSSGFTITNVKAWDLYSALGSDHFLSGIGIGDTVQVVATLKDGATVSSSVVTPTPGLTQSLTRTGFTPNGLMVGHRDGRAMTCLPGPVPAGAFAWFDGTNWQYTPSPTPGAIPFKFIDSWGWGKADVGAGTISGSSLAVTFSVTFASAPSVVATPNSNCKVWITGIGTTGFTINTDTPGASFTWIAFGS